MSCSRWHEDDWEYWARTGGVSRREKGGLSPEEPPMIASSSSSAPANDGRGETTGCTRRPWVLVRKDARYDIIHKLSMSQL